MTETTKVTVAYCAVCGWQRSTADHTRSELDWAILDHFDATGHTPIETAERSEFDRRRSDDGRSTA